jgi:hypothetical protein
MPHISVSIDDLLFGLSQSEKEELYNELKDEFGPDPISTDELLEGLSQSEKEELYDELRSEFSDSSNDLTGSIHRLTPMEQDISQVLLGIWDKRILLTPAQRQTLTDVLNASSI